MAVKCAHCCKCCGKTPLLGAHIPFYCCEEVFYVGGRLAFCGVLLLAFLQAVAVHATSLLQTTSKAAATARCTAPDTIASCIAPLQGQPFCTKTHHLQLDLPCFAASPRHTFRRRVGLWLLTIQPFNHPTVSTAPYARDISASHLL